MTKTPPSLNAVVTKHNFLLPKLAKMELSELRLLTYCLAHYDSRPEHRADERTPDGYPIPQEFLSHTATVQDLWSIFPGMDKKSAYAVVRKAVKGINSKPFEDTVPLPNGKTKDVLLYWFSGFEYYNDEGSFVFKLSPDIVHLVLSQDSNFTRFRLKHVYQFKSSLTWKLYELLKQWVVVGRWTIDLDELRMSLGIPGKYSTWQNFKDWVLEKSIKEINEQSDIIVRYEKTKRVRAVSGVVFFINAKKDEANANDPSLVATVGDTNRDIRLLMGVGVNQVNADRLSRLAAEAGKDLSVFFDRVVARYEAKFEKSDDKPVKQAYIYKALYNEFAPSLFDNLDALAAKKREINSDAKQRAISQENNKYGRDVFDCVNFATREAGHDCPAVRPNIKKCTVCNRLFELRAVNEKNSTNNQ